MTCITADGAATVETLRAELARAKERARVSNAAAKKAAADLKAEQATRRECEEKISTIERQLKDATGKCKSLKEDNKAKAAKLDKALQKAREARSESRAAREEIRQAGEIAAGKPFLLHTKFVDPKYALLNQLWSSPDALMDLPKSVSDAAHFFQAQEGHAAEKLFWSQFNVPRRPSLLNKQMAQWAELHKMSVAAMKDVVVQLWPAEPIPNSYFGLVQRLVDAVSRIDAVKRSTRIEGARMAFARVKMYWAKMKPTDVASKGPPGGKDHRTPEHYLGDVLEGARLIEGQCSKDIMFE